MVSWILQVKLLVPATFPTFVSCPSRAFVSVSIPSPALPRHRLIILLCSPVLCFTLFSLVKCSPVVSTLQVYRFPFLALCRSVICCRFGRTWRMPKCVRDVSQLTPRYSSIFESPLQIRVKMCHFGFSVSESDYISCPWSRIITHLQTSLSVFEEVFFLSPD